MARPCKSAALLTECSQTKAETDFRIAQELSLKGDADNLSPPEWLNDNQKYIFTSIVNGLKEAGILGELDTYLLAECAVCIDRLQYVEQELNNHPELLATKEGASLVKARDSYTRDFFRCCNELSLSPQSRAKIANIRLQSEQERENPLLNLISGTGSDAV